MRDINVTKYRKLLQELQGYYSDAKRELNKGYLEKDSLTDFERGLIVGQHKAYKDVLKLLDTEVEFADINWKHTHCREEGYKQDIKCYNCLHHLDTKDTWQCDNTDGLKCYLENMWIKFKEDYLNGRQLIIIDNCLYLNPDIDRVRRNNPCGMLNKKFNIKFNDGSEITTNGLYRIGTVPIRHRDVLYNNAVFDEEVQIIGEVK